MELCLTKGVDPTIYEGMALEGVNVDEEMVEYTRPMIDHCRTFMWGVWEWKVEARFNLNPLNPPVPMYGTCDFMAYNPETRHLVVVDFKSGSGVMVSVVDNDQLRYYALGAALTLGKPIDMVELTIVQPRGFHPDGPIRHDVMLYADLLAFGLELMEDANATTAPDAPLKAGEWCRWCPASGGCPAQKKAAMELAELDFDAIVPVQPTPAEMLSLDERLKVLRIADTIENWLGDVRKSVERDLLDGKQVPGWKIVARRAKRSWTNETDTEQWLLAQGFASEEIHVPAELRSPAQIEKVLGKGGKKLIEGRTQSISSGYAMVPASDSRPEIASIAAHEFKALAPGAPE